MEKGVRGVLRNVMTRILCTAVLLAGAAAAQQISLDANSIVVSATKNVVLVPTDVTFTLNVSADYSVTLEQVLAAVDFGLTAESLVGVNSYPVAPYPYNTSRIAYMLRLTVPFARMKETVDKLEKMRKGIDTNMDLSYSTVSVGPNQTAVNEAREKALPDLMADARKRAEALASAAGLTLGAIQAVNEGYNYSGVSGPILTFMIYVRFAAQ